MSKLDVSLVNAAGADILPVKIFLGLGFEIHDLLGVSFTSEPVEVRIRQAIEKMREALLGFRIPGLLYPEPVAHASCVFGLLPRNELERVALLPEVKLICHAAPTVSESKRDPIVRAAFQAGYALFSGEFIVDVGATANQLSDDWRTGAQEIRCRLEQFELPGVTPGIIEREVVATSSSVFAVVHGMYVRIIEQLAGVRFIRWGSTFRNLDLLRSVSCP